MCDNVALMQTVFDKLRDALYKQCLLEEDDYRAAIYEQLSIIVNDVCMDIPTGDSWHETK